MTLPDLLLLRPAWLIGLPCTLIAAYILSRRAGASGGWQAVVDPDLMAAMRARGYVTRPRADLEPWLMGAALALLCAGLAGPALRDRDAPALRNRDALMLVLDLSPSVTKGGGLDDAQAAIARLIDVNRTRPAGLILYSGEAFLASIPTEDPATLKSTIAVLGPNTMPVAGSRPDRALATARRALDDAASLAPDVVLVSDGGGVGPETVTLAREMAAEGMRVSAIFVAQDGAPYGSPSADIAPLVALAKAGGGSAAAATDLAEIDGLLAGGRNEAALDRDIRALVYRDLGPWIAALALLPLAALFRRRPT
ncbi:VWA domain-containing protein [Litorisediminicola beolgyonensis]|uniref:VWA domain-containing protein n=1 Tax=Litorisediminicola beolgyonensis TaxID=1173614 RepID=A0ABW3ZGY5_9RHOB